MDNWRRRNPGASPAEAFALVATERGVRRLTAVDAGAAALGLFPGQKAADAAALAPEIATAPAEPQADLAALLALTHWCERFSPAVAPDPPDGLFMDITGLAHLWGGEDALRNDFIRRLARHGLRARAAVAGTPGAAWALARFGAEGTIVPPGEEADYLESLPVTALRLDPAAAAQIARLGLITIGAVMDAPPEALTRRFGGEIRLRLDQALGKAPEALTFRRPPNPWFVRLAFVEPISTPEDLARAAGDIAAHLCARLESEAKGARRFALAFHGLNGQAQVSSVGLALPGRDPARLVRLFAPKLETVDPGFGLEAVTLAADEVETITPRQKRLDRGEAPSPEEGLAPLVDRLANRLGPGAVWRADPHPSHSPERAIRRRPPLSAPEGEDWDPERPRPLRLFRRPEPIEAMAPVPDDPPVFFRWRGAPHRVRRAEGPERLAQEWWRRPHDEADPAEARDYYRVEDEAGARFWLFRAGLHSPDAPARWWLHGLFG
jgi:protein ImuB